VPAEVTLIRIAPAGARGRQVTRGYFFARAKLEALRSALKDVVELSLHLLALHIFLARRNLRVDAP